jgi:hypothetical protein
MSRADQDRFPLLGYVIINGVVIFISLVAWYAAKRGILLAPPPEAAGRPGVAAVLIFVPLCFLLATLFDLAWRAVGRRRDAAVEKQRELAATAASSPAVKRDLHSREVEKV